MNSYLIETDDFSLRENESASIIRKEQFMDAPISVYDLEENTLDSALEDLDTYSFLSKQKVIIIRNIEAISSENEKERLLHLYRYLDHPYPDYLLIIECKKLNHTSSLSKELKKRCKVIENEISTKNYIKEKLKGYQINQESINMIDDYCLGDFTKIDQECSKLKNYKCDDKTITLEDVKALVYQKLGDPKDLTFAFTRSLAERDKKKALRYYRELLDYHIEPLSILGLLGSQIRIIYQVKILLHRNLNDHEIARMLDEKSDYRIKKTRELVAFYTENELLNLMQKLSDIDYRIKTTDTDPNAELEYFIINI